MFETKMGFINLAHTMIDICFPNKTDYTKSKYKNFKLVLIDKEYSSRLGCYNMKTKTIQLSGMKAYCRHDIIITFLHELSHHIETVDTGNSGHQSAFYDIHMKLLKCAIDLGILKVEHITNNETSNAGNKNKLKKLLGDYKRTPIYIDSIKVSFLNKLPEIVEKKQTLKVKSLPEDKQIFKDNKYRWDATENVWTKTVNNVVEYNREVAFLTKNGFMNIRIDKSSYFTKNVLVCILGNTYEHKDTISQLGYRYKDGSWSKYVKVKYIELEVAKLRKLKGIRIKYTF